MQICQSQKRTLFKWRTHTEDFKVNYKGSYSDLACELCSKHEDSQESSTRCEFVTGGQQFTAKYEEIFDDNISEETIDMITKITKKRDQYFQKN